MAFTGVISLQVELWIALMMGDGLLVAHFEGGVKVSWHDSTTFPVWWDNMTPFGPDPHVVC